MSKKKECQSCREYKLKDQFKNRWQRKCIECQDSLASYESSTKRNNPYAKKDISLLPSNEQYHLAQSRVNSAVRNGKMKPASKHKCKSCGAKAAEWHHIDYHTKDGLNVIPLCLSCHGETRLDPRKKYKVSSMPDYDDEF